MVHYDRNICQHVSEELQKLTKHQVTTGCLVYSHLSIVQHRQRCIMQMHSSFNHIKVHVSLKKDSRGSKTSSVDFFLLFRLICDSAYNRLCIETIRLF